MFDEQKDDSILNDFAYGTNVATCHVQIRLGFLRKVYGILSAQLLLTTVISALFMYFDAPQEVIKSNPWILMVSFVATMGVLFALIFKRQEIPTNYILLAVFTVLESLLVGVVVASYEVSSVILATFLTLVVTVSITLYTLQSKRDFSAMGAGLFSCLWVLIWAGILQMFLQSEMMDMALGAGGAILFSLFLVYDTHLLMHKLSPEEYMMAAINLYLDVLNLFLKILRLVGKERQ